VNCKPESIRDFLLAYFGRLPLCSPVWQPTDDSTYVDMDLYCKISVRCEELMAGLVEDIESFSMKVMCLEPVGGNFFP